MSIAISGTGNSVASNSGWSALGRITPYLVGSSLYDATNCAVFTEDLPNSTVL